MTLAAVAAALNSVNVNPTSLIKYWQPECAIRRFRHVGR
ncbi:hypothetical protein SBA3_1580012 [Candidatus Sulfopaludibacter sp. SbA3]|nr:hypothetical protein SBA3_1580012 [Candidatus Sulfopaludibacter sp. SbA3]